MAVSWLLCLGVAVVLVAVLALLVVRRGKAGVTRPSCGKCGYAVAGLPTFTCPECGSDLREVGIVMPRTGGSWGRVGWAVVWSVLWLVVLPIPGFMLAARPIVASAPTVATVTTTVTLSNPASEAYTSVELVGTSTQTSGAGRSGARGAVQDVQLGLAAPHGQAPALAVDPAALTSRWVTPKGEVHEDPFGPDVLAEWMASVGVDPNDGRVQQEIAYLDKLVRGAGQGSLASVRTGSEFSSVASGSQTGTVSLAGAGTTMQKVRLLAFTMAGGWIVIWGVGLWLCLRRGKETRTTVAAAESGTPRV